MLSPPNKQKPRISHRLASFSLLVLWVVALSWVAINHQNVQDWILLRGYDAPVAVKQLADQDGMTDYGRKVFYVNKPEIIKKAQFRQSCPSSTYEHTIVLGCYHGGQKGIFLLRVTEARLQGVEQVTAAHEMLHGAYERLSASERKRVDKMLQNYYDTGLHDQRVKKTIDAYKKSEPNDLINEMHSIFGTEIADLPSNLNDYYKRYFTNRAQVAAFAARYQSEFTSRENAVASYDAQLGSMKPQIESLETSVKSKQAEINVQQKNLVSLRSSNVAAYNAGVPAYNALVDSYNADVQQLHNLINQYNSIVATRNAIAFERDQLVKDLSSDTETINN